MRYDIVSIPVKERYRGIEREDLDLTPNKVCQKNWKYIYEVYFESIDVMLESLKSESKENLERLIKCYKIFTEYNIPCEIIVHDVNPLNDAYGYPLEWLGIDIAYAECETLLNWKLTPVVEALLNENGLCDNEKDALRVISLMNTGPFKYEPCYVYKLLID